MISESLTETAFPKLREISQPSLGASMIGKEEEALVLEVIRSKTLFRYSYTAAPEDQGKMSGTLERELCQFFQTRYALGVTSGTAALHVSLMALGVGPGDEVIVPAWSWVSCYTTIAMLGARPVLAEIDESFSIDPNEIDRLATEKTKVILVVHYQGVAADMDTILEKARLRGIAVLEDAAESPGAVYNGKRVGTMGDIGILSFQWNKCITSGEGGAVLTNSPRLYERAVRAHDLGNFRSYHETWMKPELPRFPSTQYRMHELTAAVALAQLRKLDGLMKNCRKLSTIIMAKIGALPGLTFRHIPDSDGNIGYEIYFQVETPELALEFSRLLKEHNVHSRKMTSTYPHYNADYCQQRTAHTEKANVFRDETSWPAKGYRREDFPRTEKMISRFVVLPLGADYTEADAEYIADCVVAAHASLTRQE